MHPQVNVVRVCWFLMSRKKFPVSFLPSNHTHTHTSLVMLKYRCIAHGLSSTYRLKAWYRFDKFTFFVFHCCQRFPLFLSLLIFFSWIIVIIVVILAPGKFHCVLRNGFDFLIEPMLFNITNRMKIDFCKFDCRYNCYGSV